eukprot:m.365715 g.365715  ORF g.365715 m.365715 type:complete len:86 (+) comp28089_c0_seq5:355-612(+)
MTTQTSTTTSGDGLCSGVIDESTTRLGRNIVQVSICVIGAVALVMCAYVLTAIAAFRMDKVEQRYTHMHTHPLPTRAYHRPSHPS